MAHKSEVRDKDMGYDAFVQAIQIADGASIEVGILDDEPHPMNLDISIATVLAINEFGTDTIPSRPAMRTAIDSNAAKYAVLATGLTKRIILGKLTVEKALEQLAQVMVNDIKKSIRDWSSPPNAESTIAQKGFDNPLIDTETMVNKIDSRVIL